MIIDDINTIINYKKAKAMNAAIHTLNKPVAMNNEQIVRVRDHLLHVSKASLTNIKGNRKKTFIGLIKIWIEFMNMLVFHRTLLLRNSLGYFDHR